MNTEEILSGTYPVAATYLLAADSNEVLGACFAPAPDESGPVTLIGTCIEKGFRKDGFDDLRVVQYEFPESSIPPPHEDNAERYYAKVLRPALTAAGIHPKMEVRLSEMLYCLFNSLPLWLGRPDQNPRLWQDFDRQSRAFPARYDELPGQKLQIRFPSGSFVNIVAGKDRLDDLLAVPSLCDQTQLKIR